MKILLVSTQKNKCINHSSFSSEKKNYAKKTRGRQRCQRKIRRDPQKRKRLEFKLEVRQDSFLEQTQLEGLKKIKILKSAQRKLILYYYTFEIYLKPPSLSPLKLVPRKRNLQQKRKKENAININEVIVNQSCLFRMIFLHAKAPQEVTIKLK